MKALVDNKTCLMVKHLSIEDLSKWMTSIYESGYRDGWSENNNEYVSALSDERLLEILLSVKGIGRTRAEEVVKRVLQEGIS